MYLYNLLYVNIYIMYVTIIIKEKEGITLKRSERRYGRDWREGTWEGLEGGTGAERDGIMF